MTITITLPWPDRRLSPNARLHWSGRASAVQSARRLAHGLALEAGAHRLRGAAIIRAEVVFTPPDNRKRDDDNMIGAIKAHRDGIASAIGSDDANWRTSYRIEPAIRTGPGAVTVTLEPGE